VGRALAREFLWAGDHVLITGRSSESVAAATALLRAQTCCAEGALTGMVADCSDAADVTRLAAAAHAALGGPVDSWIANAGCSGGFQPLSSLQPEAVTNVVATTLGGALLCAQAAQRLFASQRRAGTLWLTDGAGGAGDATPMYAAYGACKAGIRQLARSLVAEAREASSPPQLAIGLISPGMCLTELLLHGATLRSKSMFNALAEQPETAAAELAPALRRAHARARARRDARAPHLQVLTLPRAAARMAALPLLRGRFFDAAGRATYPPEHERIAALLAAREKAAAAALLRQQKAGDTTSGGSGRRRSGVALAYATSTLALLGVLLTCINLL
jgi:chlorophyll(ide) b reductase